MYIYKRRQSGEVSQTGRQPIPDRRSDETEQMLTKRFQFSKASPLGTGGCVKLDLCRAKLKGKREVYCRNEGTQKLLSCTRSGILQAASAVQLTVILCDLASVSSEQTVLHSSEPSAIDLSVPQTDWPRLSCSNQTGDYQSGDKPCGSSYRKVRSDRRKAS